MVAMTLWGEGCVATKGLCIPKTRKSGKQSGSGWKKEEKRQRKKDTGKLEATARKEDSLQKQLINARERLRMRRKKMMKRKGESETLMFFSLFHLSHPHMTTNLEPTIIHG